MSESCNPLLPSNKNILDQNKRVACHLKSNKGSNLKSMFATNCGSTFPSKFSSQPSTFLHRQTVPIINFIFLSSAAVWLHLEDGTSWERPSLKDHSVMTLLQLKCFFQDFWGFEILPCATTVINQRCLVCATSMRKWLPRKQVKPWTQS